MLKNTGVLRTFLRNTHYKAAKFGVQKKRANFFTKKDWI